MNRFGWIGVTIGLLMVCVAQGQTTLQTDEQTLKNHSLPTDAKGLLDFFQKRSMKDGDQKRLEGLVGKLGSNVYRVREQAAKELVTRGPIALPFLRVALGNDPPYEEKRRAEKCIAEIEATMQAEPIAAAARVLAARKDPKAAEALFNFLPAVAADPCLEEELLACFGRLTITPEKVDELVLNALKDPQPFRRVVAAYLIGRRGGAEHREALRELLADPDARVRERVAEGLFGKRPAEALKEAVLADDKILRDHKIASTDAAILEFFRKRTLSPEDQKRFRSLVRGLGDSAYVVRARAADKILKEGPPVLAFLKEAEFDTDLERQSQARRLLQEIRQANNTAVPIAAGHLLARPATKDAAPGKAIRALLAYIPFADDDAVEEEILTSMVLLSLREPKVESDLVEALDDPSPTRRAAAAFVLGHVGVKEQISRVQPLLDDLNPIVRLRAAQGMLAAHNKAALPSFVNLVQNAPATYLPRIEETLYRLAENKGPTDVISGAPPEARAKAAKAWAKWLDDNKNAIDLTNLNDRESYLGLVTIAEYDNQVGQINGQVWEGPRGGQKRWTFGGVIGAMDAHTLPNGRVLVAENSANRITERDTKGEIKWEFRIPFNGNPICCQRLPNGNTFIATYNMVMEIRPDKTEVYRYTPGPQFYIFSAHKAKNSDIVAITAQGQIVQMDSKTGQSKHTVQTQTLGNWCSVEMMPNGNFLVASMSTNSVKEIDRKSGQEVWSKQFFGAFRATRLPNGNVLVASMQTRQVAEIDRGGTIRWTVTCQGRPWGVHYR
jgi:HEAT repeat protein